MHLKNIAKIRNVLTLDTTKILLIHAFVVSKIDSYNSLIFGLPKHLIDKLQHLLNAAARLIMVANKYDSLYNNQVNARALIGQSAMVYCAGKPMEKSRVF